jgi:hypothetical protein
VYLYVRRKEWKEKRKKRERKQKEMSNPLLPDTDFGDIASHSFFPYTAKRKKCGKARSKNFVRSQKYYSRIASLNF